MPNQHPAQVGQIGHGLGLAHGFLHLVFPQFAQAQGIGFAQAILSYRLADRQQAHLRRIASDLAAGRRDTGADGFEIGMQGGI